MNENYRIIVGADFAQLARKTNEAIAGGYTTAGGVCAVKIGSLEHLAQAVVKKGK